MAARPNHHRSQYGGGRYLSLLLSADVAQGRALGVNSEKRIVNVLMDVPSEKGDPPVVSSSKVSPINTIQSVRVLQTFRPSPKSPRPLQSAESTSEKAGRLCRFGNARSGGKRAVAPGVARPFGVSSTHQLATPYLSTSHALCHQTPDSIVCPPQGQQAGDQTAVHAHRRARETADIRDSSTLIDLANVALHFQPLHFIPTAESQGDSTSPIRCSNRAGDTLMTEPEPRIVPILTPRISP